MWKIGELLVYTGYLSHALEPPGSFPVSSGAAELPFICISRANHRIWTGTDLWVMPLVTLLFLLNFIVSFVQGRL